MIEKEKSLNRERKEVEKTLKELGFRIEMNGNTTVTLKTLSNNVYNKACYFARLLEDIITILENEKN